MSWAYQLFGLPGVAWLLPLGTGLIGLALLSACRDRASVLVSGMVTLAALLAMSGSLTLRPHLVTFALTVVSVKAWLRSADDGVPRWWLVPLSWIWACSHGMWFVGVAIGAAVVVGLALDGGRDRSTIGKLALVPLLSVGAAALTPVGPILLTAPWRVREYAEYVSEWEPASLSQPFFVMFLLLAATSIVIWARGKASVSWPRVLLLGLGIVIGLMYGRTVAVGAATVAPLAAEAITMATRRSYETVTSGERWTRGVAVVAALTIAAFLAPSRTSEPEKVPSAMDPTLAAIAPGTIVCNEYRLGGWLIWRHPQLRLSIDPRTEIYSPEHAASRFTFMRAEPGWQQYPARAKCTYALLDRKTSAPEALTAQLGWSEVETTEEFVLLRAPG
jgi:hypothetical protein